MFGVALLLGLTMLFFIVQSADSIEDLGLDTSGVTRVAVSLAGL
jgi:hypothetical protein